MGWNMCWIVLFYVLIGCCFGRLAQMVERPLRMREVAGSIPAMSILSSFFPTYFFAIALP